MGKNTPGKQKTVRLSEEELKELCQKAVEDGVYKYITVQNQKKKQEWRGLLFRTKKLLENYTKLKTYGRYVWNVAHWKRSVCGKWQIIHADAGWLFGGKRVSDSQGDGSDPRNDPEIRLYGRYDRGKAV